MRSSSIVTPGSGITSEPVAIRMLRVVSSLASPPFVACTATLPGLSMRPAPTT